MANQPTKYRKFVVGAASAALVASAVAPVASAKDFSDTKGNTHEAAIDALSDAGIISGYQDGSFKPNQTLTRSDVVKLMGKWLVSVGYEVPADYKTNMRFSDLTASTNDELLKYAAVVKDNGVFNGSNGRLLAGDDITRENMAVVLVRAFDTVEDIDLVEYVSAQDFNKDVTDRNSAKAEARTAIDVLDFFDITTVAQFNPKATTTRGHFATFLNNFLNADLSDVTQGSVDSAVVSVKAVNATTVEVKFVEEVKDVKASDYSIDGLKITNAALKQSDNKVVVLTTEAQTGDKEYTVKSGEQVLGTFNGISAVIPTSITMNTTSEQGIVGKEVTLKADIGVKEAGVPVTFNVTAGSKLNKDHIEEVTTDANGIATYSYTQYVAGESDDVVAYPTGAPAVRSLAAVYWGVDSILTVAPVDKEQGNNVANGANKVYKVTSKDPKTGKPVANQKLHVTFVENVGVTIDKTSKATINGTNPMQLSNGSTIVTAEIVTDSKGEATFTVSGHNTTVTPVVFPNQVVNKTDINEWEATKLQAKVAEKVVFGAVQADYVIDVTRDGNNEEAATGVKNGREYNIVVKTKDGKVAANEIVNVAFNEDLDRNINTNTEAYFVDEDGDRVPDARTKAYTVKTDSKGEATFTIASDKDKDYATPIAWIDINTSNASEGKLDEGEPFKVAQITYFAPEKLTDGVVKAYNDADKAVKEFTGLETAVFKFTAANQSGVAMELPEGYSHIEASFTVFNTGANEITVNGHVVSPNRSYTTSTIGSVTQPAQIAVKSVDNKSTSVRVVANGTAIPAVLTNNRPINLGSHSAEANFTSTAAVGTIHTGIVTALNTDKKLLTFEGKSAISYAGATYKNANAVTIKQDVFEDLVKNNINKVKVTYKKDGDNVTFEIVSLDADLTTTLYTVNTATTLAEVQTALEKSDLSPAFANLSADQKKAVAQTVLDNRGNEYTEIGLKNAYAIAYKTEVDKALGKITTAATQSNLEAVPGLNLDAYKKLDADGKTSVKAALEGKDYADVKALQTALNNAIANIDVAKNVDNVNEATTRAEMLDALEEAGANLTDFEAAPARVQQLVLQDLVDATDFANVPAINRAIAAALVTHEDKTSVAINSVSLDDTTLTITFSDGLNFDNGDLSDEEVASLSVKFDEAFGTATVASASYNAADNKLVLTLENSTLDEGSKLTSITVNDEFNIALNLAATEADGKTLVTDPENLVVTTP